MWMKGKRRESWQQGIEEEEIRGVRGGGRWKMDLEGERKKREVRETLSQDTELGSGCFL